MSSGREVGGYPKKIADIRMGVGLLVSEGSEVGFLFGQQRNTLKASGTNTVDIGDMNVNTYHAYFADTSSTGRTQSGLTS